MHDQRHNQKSHPKAAMKEYVLELDGYTHNRDMSIQYSDLKVNGKHFCTVLDIFPPFYGKGGILHAALTGEKMPEDKQYFFAGVDYDFSEMMELPEKFQKFKIENPYAGFRYDLKFDNIRDLLEFRNHTGDNIDIDSFMKAWDCKEPE
jgi:hypothetical protein